MDRIVMKIEVIRNETLSELNELFRKKVQLQELVQDNEDKIQYKRGVMDSLEIVAGVITKILESDKIEKIKQNRLQTKQLQSVAPSGDGSRE